MTSSSVCSCLTFSYPVFFNYDYGSKTAMSIPTRDLSVTISGSKFVRNRAYGHICNSGRQAGNGGAIAVAGVNAPGVFIVENEFLENNAVTYEPGASTSLGGAISISLQSNLSSTANRFKNNYAFNGGGHDLASISGQNGDENNWNSTADDFTAYRSAEFSSDLRNALLEDIVYICEQFTSLISSSSSSSKMIKNNRLGLGSGLGSTPPFELSPHFEKALSRDLPFADSESFGVGSCSAAAVKTIRDKHFDKLDSFLEEDEQEGSTAHTDDDHELTDDDHELTVIRISLEQLLRLDLWRVEVGCGAVGAKGDDRPLRDLEERFRRSLELTLADFSRRITRGPNAMSSSTDEDDHSIVQGDVDIAISTLVRLSPDVVLTSGRANMVGSVFKGDYHLFVGNYPVIYRQIVNNPFLDPLIVTVPSYSLLEAPNVLGTLVLTAIEATVEVATRRRGNNTFIDQLNFFQSELLLNNNLTIRNTR